MADGYSSYGFETYGSEAQVGTGLMVGRVTGAVGYTRSGEVLGAAGGGRSPGVSGQVCDVVPTPEKGAWSRSERPRNYY